MHYKAHECYFSHTDILVDKHKYHCNENPLLSSGCHTIKFAYRLPMTVPGSFRGDYGAIVYQVHAEIQRPWRLDHNTRAHFRVLRPVNLSAMPHSQGKVNTVESKNFGCLSGGGRLVIIGRLHRRGYLPGEVIRVEGEVDNRSGQPMKIARIYLVQKTRYYAQRHSKIDAVDYCAIDLDAVLAQTSIFLHPYSINIPPQLSTTDLSPCRIIGQQYSVKIEVAASKLVTPLIATLPVVIGLQEENEPVAEKPAPSPSTIAYYRY